jgi:hypothetical protein
LRSVWRVYVAAAAMRWRSGGGWRGMDARDARRRWELVVEMFGRGEEVQGGRIAGEEGAGEMERARAVEE